jgi:hypothetical protein
MKLSIQPVALAVTMAVASVAAHAGTLPSYGTTSPGDAGHNDGLYLAVWDDTTKVTELVDLTALYSDVAYIVGSTAGTTSELTTPTSAFTTAANPTGAAVTVLQLDLGQISNFSSVFPSVSSSTHYLVVAGQSSNGVLSSGPMNFSYTGAAFTIQDTAVVAESSNWAATSNTSPLVDTTGTANFSLIGNSGPLLDGTEGNTGVYFGVNVGTAAGFYNYGRTSSRSPEITDVYSYNGQQGFWFLSSTGDLSWNLVNSVSSVPLPPAVWLFASGLIGLGVIGRRRQSGFGAAV